MEDVNVNESRSKCWLPSELFFFYESKTTKQDKVLVERTNNIVPWFVALKYPRQYTLPANIKTLYWMMLCVA